MKAHFDAPPARPGDKERQERAQQLFQSYELLQPTAIGTTNPQKEEPGTYITSPISAPASPRTDWALWSGGATLPPIAVQPSQQPILPLQLPGTGPVQRPRILPNLNFTLSAPKPPPTQVGPTIPAEISLQDLIALQPQLRAQQEEAYRAGLPISGQTPIPFTLTATPVQPPTPAPAPTPTPATAPTPAPAPTPTPAPAPEPTAVLVTPTPVTEPEPEPLPLPPPPKPYDPLGIPSYLDPFRREDGTLRIPAVILSLASYYRVVTGKRLRGTTRWIDTEWSRATLGDPIAVARYLYSYDYDRLIINAYFPPSLEYPQGQKIGQVRIIPTHLSAGGKKKGGRTLRIFFDTPDVNVKDKSLLVADDWAKVNVPKKRLEPSRSYYRELFCLCLWFCLFLPGRRLREYPVFRAQLAWDKNTDPNEMLKCIFDNSLGGEYKNRIAMPKASMLKYLFELSRVPQMITSTNADTFLKAKTEGSLYWFTVALQTEMCHPEATEPKSAPFRWIWHRYSLDSVKEPITAAWYNPLRYFSYSTDIPDSKKEELEAKWEPQNTNEILGQDWESQVNRAWNTINALRGPQVPPPGVIPMARTAYPIRAYNPPAPIISTVVPTNLPNPNPPTQVIQLSPNPPVQAAVVQKTVRWADQTPSAPPLSMFSPPLERVREIPAAAPYVPAQAQITPAVSAIPTQTPAQIVSVPVAIPAQPNPLARIAYTQNPTVEDVLVALNALNKNPTLDVAPTPAQVPAGNLNITVFPPVDPTQEWPGHPLWYYQKPTIFLPPGVGKRNKYYCGDKSLSAEQLAAGDYAGYGNRYHCFVKGTIRGQKMRQFGNKK